MSYWRWQWTTANTTTATLDVVSILEWSNTVSLTQQVALGLMNVFLSISTRKEDQKQFALTWDGQQYTLTVLLQVLSCSLSCSLSKRCKWTLIFWNFHVKPHQSIIQIHSINWTQWTRSDNYSRWPSRTMCSRGWGIKILLCQCSFEEPNDLGMSCQDILPSEYGNYYCTLNIYH